MTQERNEVEVARGRAAELLMENDTFREVMNGLDAQYHAAWRLAKTVEAREDCHRYVCLVERFLADIKAIADNGQFAAQRLKELSGKRLIQWPR